MGFLQTLFGKREPSIYEPPQTFVALDLETTGFEPGMPNRDRIVQVAAIKMIPGHRYADAVHWTVNPGRKIPAKATRVHGLTDADVADAPFFHEIAGELVRFIGKAHVVAHYAHFDRRFLNYQLAIAGQTAIPVARWICTVALSREIWPDESAKLDAVVDRLGLDGRTGAHDALEDATLCAKAFARMLEMRGA